MLDFHLWWHKLLKMRSDLRKPFGIFFIRSLRATSSSETKFSKRVTSGSCWTVGRGSDHQWFGDYTGVSENGGTPKSSILIGISIINLPFWGPPIFGNTHTSLLELIVWRNLFCSRLFCEIHLYFLENTNRTCRTAH